MIDYKIEKNVFYDLNIDDLEQVYDLMVVKDCLLAVGDSYNDALALHIYGAFNKHYALIYPKHKVGHRHKVEYKTKRGILNRIKKHLVNGDVSYSFKLFGGRDDN